MRPLLINSLINYRSLQKVVFPIDFEGYSELTHQILKICVEIAERNSTKLFILDISKYLVHEMHRIIEEVFIPRNLRIFINTKSF